MDPRTPVLVGVGQTADVLGTADYATLSSVELAARAAESAVTDAGGVRISILEWIDAVACTRPIDLSGPSRGPLGTSSNFTRAVASRLGVRPDRAVLELIGGQSPQRLVNEFAQHIAAGRHSAVLIAGGDAISTQMHYQHRDDAPDFSDNVSGPLEDRGEGWEYYLDDNLLAHRLFIAPAAYGLVDNARRIEARLGVESYRLEMADLLAPFTKVAADNPLAAVQTRRTAEDLFRVRQDNPLVWDPYPKSMIARDKVNLGAALIMMSVETARRCGIPQDRWVYLRGHADLVELPLLERPALHRGPASVIAVDEALRVAGVGIDDLTSLDLYSCFPAPVFNICDGFDLAYDGPRPLTVTGGLPFFGGPGNNYSMHAIAETVTRARTQPGSFGLVGANGGILSKYSVGIYSTVPGEWQDDNSGALQAGADASPRLPSTRHADGAAHLDTYTFRHGSDDPAIIIGTLDETGERFCATVDPDDPLFDNLATGDDAGASIKVVTDGARNKASLG